MENKKIDRNKQYWVLLNPYDTIVPIIGIGIVDASKFGWAKCSVDESKYNLDCGYKVTMKSEDPAFASRDFYVSDFEAMLRTGRAYEYTPGSKVVTKTWWEPLTENTHLCHEGECVEFPT